jgi:hypothetical protein
VKTIVMTILVLLVAGSGMAADKQSEKDSVKSPVTTGTQKSSGQKPAEKKPTVQWPRPYKSTEEVSADSMVPFPTDI